MPDLCKNLFSLTKCTKAGYKIIMEKNDILIQKPNEQTITGVIEDGLPRLLIKVVRSDQAYISEELSLREIHEKLGHVNLDTIRKMARENSPYDLNISDDVDFTCEACNYGKQKHSSHKLQLPKDVQPGEFIHSVVCGSFEELGLNDEKYWCSRTRQVTIEWYTVCDKRVK